jgi:hypothetical protein
MAEPAADQFKTHLSTPAMTTPQDLKKIISTGLLSFPLTDFDSQLRFAPKPFAERPTRSIGSAS